MTKSDKIAKLLSIIVMAVVWLLWLAQCGHAASVSTARGDMIGTWLDFSNGSVIMSLNDDGTGQYMQGSDCTWQFNTSQAVLTIYIPDSQTTHTMEILGDAHARMVVSWTSDNDRLQVLILDISDARANFADTDLVNTYEFNRPDDGVKVTYTFYADGYGEEKVASNSSGTTFTWTYVNPVLVITGNNINLHSQDDAYGLNGYGSDYTYYIRLFANGYLTLVNQSGSLIMLKQK